jgi:dienelactone hydrolase
MQRRELQVAMAMAMLLSAAVAWAVSRQSVRFVDFALRPAGSRAVPAVALLPKGMEKLPVVVYLHGSGDSLERSTGALRQFAELGMAAVCMDYTQTNAAAFSGEFESMLTWVARQPWADTNQVAWVGFSLGAQRMLGYLVANPGASPRFLVRLGGGMVAAVTNSPPKLSGRAWLVHGEADETFRLPEAVEVQTKLRAVGMAVELTVLPKQPHAFGENRALVHRLVAERCAQELSASAKESAR